ncbi:MAG TPA: carboxymuconolactone decarboxylase family protein [Candidatus Woesearchaeota archaeon]|nr:carboxymuconolactone decarboxylase family protein [Candidatus Woesearchaeota archaeon]
MKNYKELLEEIQNSLEKFSKETPEQMKAFHELMQSTEKEGKLNKKTKELIALGCAIVSHCEWCIAFHTKGALDAGATREEILESAWTAVLMGGGPALMYAQGVLKALEDLK